MVLPAASFATCYTVYNSSDKAVYKSPEPPFDMSTSISDNIKSKYPGGYLLQDNSASCSLPKAGDVTHESINAEVKKRNSDPRSRYISVVRTDKQTDDQIANGERIRTETENLTQQDTMKEAKDTAKKSGKCKFKYYEYNDDIGAQLAQAAGNECLNNEALKKTGQSSQVSLEAYNAWKDHYQITSNQRTVNQQRIQNAEANRQLNQKLDGIRDKTDANRQKLDAIRHTQKYGY